MNQPMNLLLLHTDQQRFDTIAAHGNPHIKTPNLDRLVRGGTSFMRTYSSNPICMPARHDLITGVSARHHGYWKNTGRPIADYALPTLPRLLSLHDYQTVAVGKMHFFPAREHHGFNHMFLMEEIPTSREEDAYLQYLDEQGYGNLCCEHGVRPLFYHTPQAARVPEEHHGSAWVAHKTIELLKTQRKNPFFIFASWVGPHPPYYVPQRFLEMYRDAPLPPPIPREADSRQAPPSPENAEGPRLRRMREAYYAATTFIDHQIGRILDTLEETGQMDNTLIVFTTDHGESLGDRGLYQKMHPHDSCARIPLIVHGPGFEADRRVDTPATTWDISATLLKAAQIPAPDTVPLMGRPLDEVAADAGPRVIHYSFADGRERYVAAVDGHHKFVHYYNGGDETLHDLRADPHEVCNLLAASPAHPAAAPLRAACIAFEQTRGQAKRIRDGAFADDPFEPVSDYFYSLYPLWSSAQLPRWMPTHTPEVLDQIATEMRDCFREATAFIHTDPAWRVDAVARWRRIGGEPAVYEKLFEQSDAANSAGR